MYEGMALIPAGRATIGSPPEHLDAVTAAQHYPRVWFEDEAPQHTHEVRAFYLANHPVTNAQFAEFVLATGYVTRAERRGVGLVYGERYWDDRPGACWRHPGGPNDSIADRMDHPVVHVEYDEAVSYAAWVGKRLPTEAEWEYAAHGPSWTAWPWGDAWDPQRANTAEHWAGGAVRDFSGWRAWWQQHYAHYEARPATTPIGRFSPAGDSPFGITDMAGNVAEWTCSIYQPYDPTVTYDPGYMVAMKNRFRAVRGGSWKNFRFQTRTSERIACRGKYSNFETGFRCAADAER